MLCRKVIFAVQKDKPFPREPAVPARLLRQEPLATTSSPGAGVEPSALRAEGMDRALGSRCVGDHQTWGCGYSSGSRNPHLWGTDSVPPPQTSQTSALLLIVNHPLWIPVLLLCQRFGAVRMFLEEFFWLVSSVLHHQQVCNSRNHLYGRGQIPGDLHITRASAAVGTAPWQSRCQLTWRSFSLALRLFPPQRNISLIHLFKCNVLLWRFIS